MDASLQNRKMGTNRSWKKRLFIILGLAWPVIHLLVFWVYVNLGTVYNSFFRTNIYGDLIFNGIESYKRVFRVIFMGEVAGLISLRSFWNTLSMIGLALIVNLPLTLLFSYMIYKKIRLYSIWRVALYIPSVVSIVILCLFFRIIFSGTQTYTSIFTLLEILGYKNQNVIQNGMFATSQTAWWGIIIFSIWTGVNGNIIYFSSAMARLPEEVIESAQIDGASDMRQFVAIVIPMIWGTITTMSVTLIGGAIGIFQPMQLIIGSDMGPVTETGTIGWIIVDQVAGQSTTSAFPAALSVVVSVVGAVFVFVFKTLMEKAFKEVEY